jgi:hypothetical protein
LIDGYFNILFIDESRRSINTELRRVLAPKGSKPIVRVNNLRREGVYVYCALNARSGEAFIKLRRKQTNTLYELPILIEKTCR